MRSLFKLKKSIFIAVSVAFLTGCEGTSSSVSVGYSIYGGYGYGYGYGYYPPYYRPPRPPKPDRPDRPKPEHPIAKPDRPMTKPSVRPSQPSMGRPSARPSRPTSRPSSMSRNRR